MSNSKEKEFVAWEYDDINVKKKNVALYTDCYQNFGWILIEECALHYTPDVPQSNVSVNHETSTPTVGLDHEMVKLKFKRDSRLPNKVKLEQLQEQCEGALSSIQHLENEKSGRFMGFTIGLGIVGALFLGLSIFNFASANIVLGVLFAVISLIGWVAAFFVSTKVQPNVNAKINLRIKEQFEVVYQLCEQANSLLVCH